MNKTATFTGHRECITVEKESVYLIQEWVVTFLSGGMGNFDWLCASTVYDLKQKYSYIKNILVIPYLTFRIRNKAIFDEIEYPESFEKYHFKAAILKRNRFLEDNSQYAVCHIKYGWGEELQKRMNMPKNAD